MSHTHAMLYPSYAAASSRHKKYGHVSDDARPASEKNKYEIVSDGSKFGVAFKGEIKIHGLEYARAQYLAEILNGIDELDRAH